jgi:signal-transduction protein with cAMP-binding, CBS, and nucleotidyltransferase domain
MNIADIVKGKDKTLFTIKKSSLAVDAVAVLDKYGVGALMVLDDKENVAGIISERDILYKCYKSGEPLKEKKVEALMTKVEDIIVGKIDDTPRRMMNMMVTQNIRHVPIIEGNTIIGIVSIDDLLQLILENSEVESRKLREFISNPYGINIYDGK